MKILHFVTESLGDSSYLVIDGAVAAVIDPQRDVHPFLVAASEHGATITHTFETHVHNDYLSGSRELTARGAVVAAPAASGLQFAHYALADGDELSIGSTRLRAIATPGHTHEHTAYLALDPSDVPQAAFTGGSLLVSSAGRTDLLGRAETDQLTRLQWESAHRLSGLLPGTAGIFPTHGAGSFCSTSSSTDERSSMMYLERQRNPVLSLPSLEGFRTVHLAYEPPIPAYYRYMAPANRVGPGVYLDLPLPAPLTPADVASLQEDSVHVLDVRRRNDFASGFIPGAICVEESSSMLAYVSWVIPFNAPLVVVAYDRAQANRVTVDLFRIGYEDVRGSLAFESWANSGRPLDELEVVSSSKAAAELVAGARILDVRFGYEHRQTPLRGALERSLDDIAEWSPTLDGGRYFVLCQSGMRAAIAASVLRKLGNDVRVIIDGGAGEVNAEVYQSGSRSSG